MSLSLDDLVLDIIKEYGPLTTKEILEFAQKKHVVLDKDYINSILYGYLREVVVRDRNEFNIPTWRLKTQRFEAAKGYEATLFNELIKKNVVSTDEIFLDFEIRHSRTKKTYHLDIALFSNGKKINVEVDGFDHMRADARLSIQKQLLEKGKNCEIEVDWMDNETSFVDFKKIDNKLVNSWCTTHLSWCISFHEELLWPHDITRNIFLIEQGYKIIRFWNRQIQNNLSTCVKEIKELVSS